MNSFLRYRKVRRALQLLGLYQVSGPEFLVIGAPKAGSTTLFSLLRSHPQIVESFGVTRQGKVMKKELRFFNKAKPLSAKMKKEYQLSFLPDWSSRNLLRFEGTPDYLESPSCPERINAYSPKMKLIVVLREPCMRAFSHWKMYHYRDENSELFDSSSFRSAVENRESSYVRKGLYAQQLERYLQYFPSSQLLVLDFEELIQNQQDSMDRITNFLSIRKHLFTYTKHNVRKTKGLDDDINDVLSELRAYYAPHNRKLQKVLADMNIKMSWLG